MYSLSEIDRLKVVYTADGKPGNESGCLTVEQFANCFFALQPGMKLSELDNDCIDDCTNKDSKSRKILTDILTSIGNNCGPKNAGGEPGKEFYFYIYYSDIYNDKYYKDIYALHYSHRFFPISQMCCRFFLFDAAVLDELERELKEGGQRPGININDAFIGVIVKRPLPGYEIGRTYIDPKYFFDIDSEILHRKKSELKSNIWRNEYHFTMFGIPLSIWAFPFSMQDGEVQTCAEITVQNLTDYYSYRYPEYKAAMPSEIDAIVHNNSESRSIPTSGLTYEMVSRIFMELGYSPILYAAKDYKWEYLDILHCYVASAVPVALGITNVKDPSKRHSIIVIGTKYRFIDSTPNDRKELYESTLTIHLPNKSEKQLHFFKMKGALKNTYIVMDDGRRPYSEVQVYEKDGRAFLNYIEDKNDPWEISTFLVPLSSEMAMDAGSARDSFQNVLIDGQAGYSVNIGKIKNITPSQKTDDNTFDENEIKAKLFGGMIQYQGGKGDRTRFDEALVMRIFLCQSKQLKEQRIKGYVQGNFAEDKEEFQKIHLPRFVWVCEIYTKASCLGERPFCVGEIILDATKGCTLSENSIISNVIWINYSGTKAFRKPGESEDIISELISREKSEFALTEIAPFKFNP